MSKLPDKPSPSDRRGGFTLLEVLVAFVILSVSLVALMRGFSSGLGAVGAAADYRTAVLLARSKIDEIGPVIELTEGRHGGTLENGYEWQADIAAYDLGHAPPFPVLGYQVTVTVEWQGGRAITLTSLRLAAAE